MSLLLHRIRSQELDSAERVSCSCRNAHTSVGVGRNRHRPLLACIDLFDGQTVKAPTGHFATATFSPTNFYDARRVTNRLVLSNREQTLATQVKIGPDDEGNNGPGEYRHP